MNVNIQQAIPLSKDITATNNERLTREVTINEVWQAVKQTGPLKAPGADDMHAILYYKCWNVIGQTIYNMIRAFLHHGQVFKELNNTYITLIPKKENLFKVNDFRPINLCNFSYKFISKLLVIDYIQCSQS